MNFRHWFTPFVVFFCLLIITQSCGLRNGLQIRAVNFTDVVAPNQNLSFVFEEKVVDDSLMNSWDSTQYVVFNPAVSGKFKWVAQNELVFSPESGFAPSTNYTATITEQILGKGCAKKSLASGLSYNFHTPYLDIASLETFWTKADERGGEVELRATLQFNYNVSSERIAELLHCSINGKQTDFVRLGSTFGKEVHIAFRAIENSVDEGSLEVTIDPGAICEGSNYRSEKPMNMKAQIISRKKLEIRDCYGEFEQSVGQISVVTSQSVDANNLASHLVVEPQVAYTATATETGFVLKGAFSPQQSYSLTIKQSLRGVLGGAMSEDYSKVIKFGQLQPSIQFASKKAMYLTPKGARNLGIMITNIPKVNLKVYKIFDNNIQAFLRDGRRYYYDEMDYSDGDNDESRASRRKGGYGEFSLEDSNFEDYGKLVAKRTIEVSKLPKNGNLSLLNFSLEEYTDFKGIYVVKVESESDNYITATKLITVSDIGLITKKSLNDVWVFCNSIKTAEPISGVSVKFLSSNNQTVYTAMTDGSGIAKFEGVLQKASGFKLGMITASLTQDFTYMMFADTKVETSRFDVGGIEENSSGMQAFLYGDRDVYRPGETVRLNTIIRTAEWSAPDKTPVKIIMTQPNGKEYRSFKLTPNSEGAVPCDIPTQRGMITGTYTVEVSTLNDILLATRNIVVEEFMPDRIKVNLSLNKNEYSVADSIVSVVSAQNYFGPPAVNRTVETEFSLQRKQFSPKQFKDYEFGIQSKNTNSLVKVNRSNKTDNNGIARETFVIPAELAGSGMVSGTVYTTVFDETGRPVSRAQVVEITTQKAFFGIRRGDSYVSTGSAESIPLVAVDKNGNPTQAQAKVTLVKRNWQTVMEKTDWGGFNYISRWKEQVVSERVITINGSGSSFSFVPQTSGDYEVRVSDATISNGAYVKRRFWSYGWESTTSTAFEVNREGTIDITFDKEKYTVGDKANVLFKSPFAGKLLVTVERSGIKSYQYINTKDRSAMMTLPITEDMIPNMYVSATLFKPLDDGAMPLTVAHGFSPFFVETKNSQIALTINAPDRSKSNTKQTITVKAQSAGQVEMTVAVVDEGVLSIKRTATPNPHGYFYQKRALGVESFDVYPYIFPDLMPGKVSFGAGEAADMMKMMNMNSSPVQANRVSLVSYWSGVIQTNSAGEASYTIDIPQFSGALRIMAVAYKGKSFGSAEKRMTVADQVVVSAGLPRVLSPNDTVQMPVTMFNTTTKPLNATATVSLGGNLSLIGGSSQSAMIQPNSEQRVMFTISAQQTIGVASVNVQVKAGSDSYSQKTEIAIRPNVPFTRSTGNGTVSNGETKSLALNGSYIPSTLTTKLVVSCSMIAQFTRNLSELIGYPHGCLEQTVSKAFPQLYVADLAKATSQNANGNTQMNVQEAISKLQTMQLYNGGLSYWQGTVEDNWWGSVYSAHFLIEARKAGYQVDDNFLDKLLQYLAMKARTKDQRTYYYYDDASGSTTKQRKIAPQEITYSLYVLALSGRKDASLMNYYKANVSQLTQDARYMLACTYLYLGDKSSFNQLTPTKFSEYSAPELGGTFGSYLRDEALTLSVLADVDYTNPQVMSMARHLSSQMSNQRFYSTQENAFALLALGKIARKMNNTNATATISYNGKSVSLTSSDVVLTDVGIGKNVSINAKGGSVYYYWEVGGVAYNATNKQEDNMLKIRRTFLDRNGAVINSMTFKQSDLVVVKLTVSSLNGSTLENVAITDLLPSGFELENPRIKQMPELGWAQNSSEPEYLDFRDDRVNFFTTVVPTEKTFYYVVRAVTPGRFSLAPSSAEAMYFGDYHSYNGGGVIRITPR